MRRQTEWEAGIPHSPCTWKATGLADRQVQESATLDSGLPVHPTANMGPPRASSSSSALTSAYSLSLLSEYTNILESLPIELSRNFADLRELDAVLSSSMTLITTKINALTAMIEEGTIAKEERLWLLTEIATEASRLKPGGEDKIRVACQAADNLKSHSSHLRTLLEHLPSFDTTTLNRNTTYPHIAPRSFMPAASLESGRRRRGGFGSLLSAPDPSPAKRKRVARDDDTDVLPVRSPRKEKVADMAPKPRNGARAKKSVWWPPSPDCSNPHFQERACCFANRVFVISGLPRPRSAPIKQR